MVNRFLSFGVTLILWGIFSYLSLVYFCNHLRETILTIALRDKRSKSNLSINAFVSSEIIIFLENSTNCLPQSVQA